MGLIYQSTIKNTFEHKILNKIKNSLDLKLKKENIIINENIFIGFSYGNYHGTNVYYLANKHLQTAKFLKNILENQNIDIRCFSNLKMEYDIEILIGYANNKKEKNYIKNSVEHIIDSFYKTFSILQNGVYICS